MEAGKKGDVEAVRKLTASTHLAFSLDDHYRALRKNMNNLLANLAQVDPKLVKWKSKTEVK